MTRGAAANVGSSEKLVGKSYVVKEVTPLPDWLDKQHRHRQPKRLLSLVQKGHPYPLDELICGDNPLVPNDYQQAQYLRDWLLDLQPKASYFRLPREKREEKVFIVNYSARTGLKDHYDNHQVMMIWVTPDLLEVLGVAGSKQESGYDAMKLLRNLFFDAGVKMVFKDTPKSWDRYAAKMAKIRSGQQSASSYYMKLADLADSQACMFYVNYMLERNPTHDLEFRR